MCDAKVRNQFYVERISNALGSKREWRFKPLHMLHHLCGIRDEPRHDHFIIQHVAGCAFVDDEIGSKSQAFSSLSSRQHYWISKVVQ
jgi:hypothetical protein